MGNFVGTASVCKPVRSSLATTCTRECSNQASNSSGLVARALKELRGEGWVVRNAQRCQEHVNKCDPLKCHGYVVLMLGNPEDQDARLFVRIDYGQDGYRHEAGPTKDHFRMYSADAGTWVGVGGMGAAQMALVFTSTAPQTLAVVGLAAAGGHYFSPDPAPVPALPTRPDKRREDPLCRLWTAVERHSDRVYDLTNWNCNHFANLAMTAVTGQQ